MASPTVPMQDIARVRAAQRRFDAAIEVAGVEPTMPSALPGWTIGHLLTHVAQELEVHVVDLNLGPTHRDWSDEFVQLRLPSMRASLAARLPAGVEPVPATAFADERDELAWLYGRLDRDDLPRLAAWG